MKKKNSQHIAAPIPANAHRRLFIIVTIVVIAVVLVGLEIALRLFHYGRDLDLVSVTKRNGKEYCSISPTVGMRYFDPKRYALPKVENGYFLREKPADAIRIFCLGASTTAGFPYEYNATPSRMLQKRLEIAFPGRVIEVINAGLTATNSYTVVEFARELARYQPDAFVVYSGQNEFYGALGVGSTVSAGRRGGIVRLYLTLRRAKTFLLFEEMLSGVIRGMSSEQNVVEGTLMQQMAAEKAIPIGSPLYNGACEAYEQNLQELAAICSENKIPLVLSTLVTNERGLSPFVSIFLGTTDEKERKEAQRLIEESKQFMNSSGAVSAKTLLQSAIGIDSTYALAWFTMARCYEMLGRSDSALRAYGRARDCDGLRFRAPSAFNAIVWRIATASNSVLADADSAFRAESPQGIIGNELLWEHVHPRLHGYGILAKVWYNALLHTTAVGRSSRSSVVLSDSAVQSALHMTPLDEAFGWYKMERLKNRWPFVTDGSTIAEAPLNDTTRVVKLFLDGKLRWNEAHYEMADVCLKNRDFAAAAKEYEAVSEFYREDPFPLMRAGDMHAALGRYEDAAQAYEHAIAISDNQFARLKLGVVLIELKQPQNALEHLMRSVELDAQASQTFSRAQKNEAAYYYALALSQTGRKAESIQVLSMILGQNSKDQKALQLLQQLRKQ